MFWLFRIIFLLLIDYVIPVDEPWFAKKNLIDEYSPGKQQFLSCYLFTFIFLSALNIYPVIGSLLSPIVWYKQRKAEESDKLPTDYVESVNELFKSRYYYCCRTDAFVFICFKVTTKLR